MQVFVPVPDFRSCARSLDLRRLRSQINEALVLLRAVTGQSTAWARHPAARAWEGCGLGLWLYREACRAEYAERTGEAWGVEFEAPDGDVLPSWWGDDAVHRAHRAILLGKWFEGGAPIPDLPDWPPTERAERGPDGRWPYIWPKR